MEQFLQRIRTHFNVVHKDDFLSLTLINPNLDLAIINQLKNTFRLQHHIKKQEIIIIESANFNDQLLQQLAEALPASLQEISIDFTGCESLTGTSFLNLFEKLSSMNLRKLKLDLSEVYDLNDAFMQGLSLLLQSLEDLQEFYLDLYEVDQVQQDGYIVLADSLSSLQKLSSLHLDFSANPNLTEDNLELFFTNIHPLNLEKFTFRILDIDHIGGGSFFKLGQAISKMSKLEDLSLTISTFSNLNQKGVYSILKEITYLDNLKILDLNFSNIQLPQKVLSYLNLPSSVQKLKLDVSCNSQLTDGDMLTLIKNVKNLSQLCLNIDFCSKISEDSLLQLLQIFFNNKKCTQLALPDRNYSLEMLQFVKTQVSQIKSLIQVQVAQIVKQFTGQWTEFQTELQKRRKEISGPQEVPQQSIIQKHQQNM